jgi:hypothetical protein
MAALSQVNRLNALVPAAAIEHAQGLWNTFDHADAIAFSRTTDLEIGKLNARHVLRQFGQVPTGY